MKRFLLCTDLDRTLIPNGKQAESPQARERFSKLANQEASTIAYVSGRHRALIESAISDFNLPQPDFAIADVGSTIYRIDTTGWHQWEAWDEQIAPDWQGYTHHDLQNLLSHHTVLQLQEKEKQNRHKLSYYVKLATDIQGLIAEVDALLKQNKIRANLIWSIDEIAQTGLLDILPVSANKLHAIRFLMQHESFNHDNTVFSGDSGNDLDVLLSDISSVLVANADIEVKRQAAHADKATLYLSQGGYLGMNGNYSAGILEGVAHYLPDVDAWLHEQN